jgi:ABC-type ATPase with predicted acetyltransferase domain
MIVERGDIEDWKQLHHLHYKSDGRPMGSQWWRLSLRGDLIGVLALTIPKPLLKQRHILFPQFAPGSKETKFSNTWRFKWINEAIRVVGRIVLDTRFRGIGASYRFQNLVARMSGIRIVEIQSAMSKYNLFAQRAGFTFVKPLRSNKYEIGIRFFTQTFEAHPADTVGLMSEIRNMRPAIKTATIQAMRDFYAKNSAMEKTGNNRFRLQERVAGLSDIDLMRNLQQLVLASPLYGYYVNPDFQRLDMPVRISLDAFDRQLASEPLILI